MKASEILKAAKALIELPENWIRGTFATLNGEVCGIEDGECFCTAGAIYHAGGLGKNFQDQETDAALKIVRDTLSEIVGDRNVTIPEFNDSAEHEKVMELFDLAIDMAEKKEK